MNRTLLALSVLLISTALSAANDKRPISPAPWVEAQTKADTPCGPAADQTCDSNSEICCNRNSAYWYCCARHERCGSLWGLPALKGATGIVKFDIGNLVPVSLS